MTWTSWALLAAVFAAVAAVTAKAGVKNVDSDLAMAIRTTVILVLAWIVVALRGKASFASVSSKSWQFLAWSGVAAAGSWFCYFRALQLGDVSKVAPIDKLSLVIAMLLAFFLLREQVTPKQWAGALLMVVGGMLIAK